MSKDMIAKNTTKGVILLEAILAAGVMAIIFTASLSLLTRSIGGISNSTDTLIASFLAQDGVEYIQAIYEYNLTHELDEDRAWDDNITCAVTCGIDTLDSTIKNAELDASKNLYFDNGTKLYGPNTGGSATKFTRSVSVETLANPDIRRIVVTVSWTGDPVGGSVELPFNLYSKR